MGQKGSSWKKDKIPKSPNEVCSKLNSSSSSYYSNYPELRNEAQTESQCLNISYKKKIPEWLRFFHSKCENLAPSELSWAQNGKILQEMETMRNFREEYDKLFQRKLKETKSIVSNRESMIQKDPEPNLENVLSDLNETAQVPSTLQGLSAAVSKNSDENQQEGSKLSEKTSQLQESEAQQQSQGEPNSEPGENTSFPSYMVDNEFEGLRAGNNTMLRLQDPESLKKNLLIYFQCTALISEHLEDNNFTLSEMRKLFVSCFYNRYSVAIKNFKKVHKEILRKQTSLEDKQNPSLPREGIFENSLDCKSVDESEDQGVGINGSDCKLGIQIGSLQFTSEEKFKPPSEAKKIFKDALSEFQYFVKIYMETIKQYYDIHYLKDPQVNAGLKELFSYRNFENYVVSKLFENEKIPKMLIEVLKIVSPDDTSLMASIQMSSISPYLFGVPPAFSLDADTQRSLGIFNSVVEEEPECAEDTGKFSRNYEEDKEVQKEENGGAEKDLDSDDDDDEDMVFDLKITSKKDQKIEAEYEENDVQIINSNASSLSQENLFGNNKEPPTRTVNPYERCIDCIARIVQSTTPTGKFKQIILACEGIEKCISEYYLKLGKTLKYTLDEDNIISILTYIIAQAEVPNLEAHCKFVNAFYKSPTKKLKLRYYLLAFEVSIRNVHELFSQGESYEKAPSMEESDINEDQPADVSMNTSARCLFQKNTSRKLEETFGNSENPKYIASITGKNSLLKETLEEIKL